MRIVITKNGKIIVRELDDESPEIEKQKSKFSHSSSLTKLPIISSTTNDELLRKYSSKNNEFLNRVLKYRETFQSKRSSSIIDKSSLESFYNRDESKINLNELNQAKRIKLSHPKLNMTQAFLDKYDDYDVNYKKKLNELSNNLNSKNNSPKKSEEKSENNEDNNNNINQNINNNLNFNSNYNNFVLDTNLSKLNLTSKKSLNTKLNINCCSILKNKFHLKKNALIQQVISTRMKVLSEEKLFTTYYIIGTLCDKIERTQTYTQKMKQSNELQRKNTKMSLPHKNLYN